MRRYLIPLLLFAFLVSCSKGGSLVTNNTSVEVTGPLGSKPTVKVPDGTPPATLQIVDVTEGDGAVAGPGKTVSVQYVGIAWSSKKEFDASWGRGQPFDVTLGQNQVIQGWEQGFDGMKVGGRRLLVIPPSLGYGARGAGAAIGPNETLVFVVDLIKVT